MHLFLAFFLLNFMKLPGLPDESFNKNPNNAKNRPEKGQTDCLMSIKKTLFTVLPFVCQKIISGLQAYQKNFS